MVLNFDDISEYIDDSERADVEQLVTGDKVSGFAIFDEDGSTKTCVGLSETTIAVFANVVERSTDIGAELGEMDPRAGVFFPSRYSEILSRPLKSAHLLVLKDKGAGLRREFQHATN